MRLREYARGTSPEPGPQPPRAEAVVQQNLPEWRGQVHRRMTDLSRIIRNLIDTGRESDYWDFKCKPHAEAKAGELIKDIICLANSMRHDGDRYIIYGVDDTGMVVGLQSDTHRTQADIVNMLSNAGFSGGVFPDIFLHRVEIKDQQLEVLVIKDRPEKPYYLEKEYPKHKRDVKQKRGVRLNPGTVYSRVRDSNTSSDQVASSNDIERMWRQRFGIDQTPLQRVQNYLLDKDKWTETSEYAWYFSQFPEFTISPTEEEKKPVRRSENWVRAATSPSAFVRPFRICYHQTVLTEIDCILYDEMRAITPAPQATLVNHAKGLWFFSLSADTLQFLFLQFLTRRERDKLLKNGLIDGRGRKVPVVLFRSDEERQTFEQELERSPVTGEGRHDLIIGPNDPMISEQDRRIIAFSEAVIERYSEWRARNS